jgi:hypothetical protein
MCTESGEERALGREAFDRLRVVARTLADRGFEVKLGLPGDKPGLLRVINPVTDDCAHVVIDEDDYAEWKLWGCTEAGDDADALAEHITRLFAATEATVPAA